MCCGSEPCERRDTPRKPEHAAQRGLPASSRSWTGRRSPSRSGVFPRRRAVRRAARVRPHFSEV